METQIKDHLLRYDVDWPLPPAKYIPIIYDLFFKNIVPEVQDSIIATYSGIYYTINHDYAKAINYLIVAINDGHHIASQILGNCYFEQDDNINAIKYWLQSIERGNHFAMNRLGVHYYRHNNVANAIKYFLMAANYGHTRAMLNVAWIYKDQRKCALAFKYWLLAVEHGDFSRVESTLQYLCEYDLLDNGILFVNKVLNKGFNSTITMLVMSVVNMNPDMVNIIVNMDVFNAVTPEERCNIELYNKFKELVDL